MSDPEFSENNIVLPTIKRIPPDSKIPGVLLLMGVVPPGLKNPGGQNYIFLGEQIYTDRNIIFFYFFLWRWRGGGGFIINIFIFIFFYGGASHITGGGCGGLIFFKRSGLFFYFLFFFMVVVAPHWGRVAWVKIKK